MSKTLKSWFVAVMVVVACGLAVQDTVQAGKPGGVGSNLHRRFMIKQAQRRASQGLPVRRHVGIWNAGGFRSTVYRNHR